MNSSSEHQLNFLLERSLSPNLPLQSCYARKLFKLPYVAAAAIGSQSDKVPLCQAVTHIADPRSVRPPPPQSPSHVSAAPTLAPSPYNHALSGQPPHVHRRKRAVICGISYRYSRHELKGCINEAKYLENCGYYMHEFLEL